MKRMAKSSHVPSSPCKCSHLKGGGSRMTTAHYKLRSRLIVVPVRPSNLDCLEWSHVSQHAGLWSRHPLTASFFVGSLSRFFNLLNEHIAGVCAVEAVTEALGLVASWLIDTTVEDNCLWSENHLKLSRIQILVKPGGFTVADHEKDEIWLFMFYLNWKS